jgi:hypothetical protein
MNQPRPICTSCNQRVRAVAYRQNNKVQYRRLCEWCIKRKRKEKPPVPRWQSAGYKKKPQCDRCGFKAKFSSQLLVYHIDGKLTNVGLNNLRTVCLNCVEEVKRLAVAWKESDLQADH